MLHRFTFLAWSILFLAGCAPAEKVVTPLPLDVKVTAPASDVPREMTVFSGTWVGAWVDLTGGGLDHTLVVEKIEKGSASLIYSWGTNASWRLYTPGFVRATATIEPNGNLKATLSNGAQVVYKLSSDQQSLIGTYTLRGRVTPGQFKRIQP